MQTVVLYGNSLVVSTFGASLEGLPGLRLLRVEPAAPGMEEQLCAIQPNIVIFDLAAEHTDFAVSLWKTMPDLLLIGVNPDSSQMLVLSGRQRQAQSVEDLLSIIQGETRG
jgi:hypothetical protein